MSDVAPFIDLALGGAVMADEIDDFVSEWHAKPNGIDLHSFLGLSWDEYSLWVMDPDNLTLIINARRNGQSIQKAVNDNLRDEQRLAARSDQSGKLAALRSWIEAQPDR